LLDLRAALESVIAYASVLDCVDATATATSGLAVAAGTLVTGLAAVEISSPTSTVKLL
jgi:hypothetical protein